MFCQACGGALTQQKKYCKHCGARVLTPIEVGDIESAEDRLREELVDLFWVTVVGLGLILGGMVLIKQVLALGYGIIVGYLILSSTAFLINFGLSLWQIRRLARVCQVLRGGGEPKQLVTNELNPLPAQTGVRMVPSVTEKTTRRLGSPTE